VDRRLSTLISGLGLEKLFGGRSVAYDFVDLVQNGFCIRLAPKAFVCKAHLSAILQRRPLCLG
jgi:hypothetical protein